MNKVFELLVTVTIGKTNAQGDVYWTRYCEWFGEARELFFLGLLKQVMPAGVRPMEFMIAQDLAIDTGDAAMKYAKKAFLGDELIVRIGVKELQHASAKMICEVVRKDAEGIEDLIATGSQMLVFTNADGSKIKKIPGPIKALAAEYLTDTLPAISRSNLRDRQFPGLGVHPPKEADALVGASA